MLLDAIELVDIEQLSKSLKISSRTIRRMADDGRFPAPIRLGSSIRWSPATVAAWLNAGRPKHFTTSNQPR